MTDWLGRPVGPGLLGELGVDFARGRNQAPEAGIVFSSSLGDSFREYLSSPIRRLRGWEELQDFLRLCRYEKDEERFSRPDVWLAPAEFERSRAGDCEDHALWAWVQCVRLGIDARFTTGYHGTLHAWVTLYPEIRVFETTEKREGYEPEEPKPDYDPLWSVDGRLQFYWHRPDYWRGPAALRT